MRAITDMQPQSAVIDLAELRGADEFPAYAAVYSDTGGNPFVLAADVMRWSDAIHLSRLGECRKFWLEQKKKLRCKTGELFEPLLRHHYGDGYIAVFGDHPWQCLLYLHYQKRHDACGLFFLQSPINRSIYKNIDWGYWFDAQQALADHLAAISTRGFRREGFRASQMQMRRFIDRVGIDNPRQIDVACANSITRRFGKWLGQVWRWSFNRCDDLQGFPWIRLRQQKTAALKRDLEYPVSQWQYIELLLREDFEKLCGQSRRDDCEHINRMHWEIMLFNYRKLLVEISFRHPYSLHRDSPGFETALYQARYLYDNLMSELVSRDDDLDLPEQMPFIGWRLEVRERIQLAPTLMELFAGDCDDIDYERICALQNKLPLAFESYRAQASYFPEQSFATCAPGGRVPDVDDEYAWSCSAFNKPLFYCPRPQAIDAPEGVQKIFLERNADQWWLGREALQSIRDYFLLKDNRGRRSWVYRTADGAWFKQGEFC